MFNPIIKNYKKPLSLPYEDLLVNKEIDYSINCPICFNILEDNRQGCPEGHVFCNKCITQWLKKHHNCPMCRQVMSPCYLSKNKYLECIIKKLKVFCPNKFDLNNKNDKNGCNEVHEIGKVDLHSNICIHRFILCQYGGENCSPVRLNKLLSHEIECPFLETNASISPKTLPIL